MITAKQIAALKFVIFRTKDGADLSKQILAFLLDRSANMTKEVCLTLVADRDGFTANEISDAIDDIERMKSGSGSIHLTELVAVSGGAFSFNFHYGDFDPSRTDEKLNSDGQFAGVDVSFISHPGLIRKGMPLRYTIWLSKEPYAINVELVNVTRSELESIDLKKPGLYPSIEHV